MKIGIVCYPTFGGSGVVATRLGMALARLGHSVHFISYEMPFRLNTQNENIYFHQVEINRYDLFQYPDYALTLAVKMAEVARKEKLDIFHVHYAIPHATSAFLAKELVKDRAPILITTLHGTDITLVGKDPAYFEIVKYSIEKSDIITAVSHHLANETKRVFSIKKPIDVIYNFFIPDERLKSQKPMRSSFVTQNEKLILHVSNFREVKRVQDVISVFARITSNVPSKLLLIGSGPMLEDLYEQVSKQGLGKKVFFLGLSCDVDPYIASSDLFLLPSSQESFGLVALEAMAYGVCVIGTNTGGIPEVVIDGKTGFLSEVGDIEKMASDGIKLLKDEALREAFGLEGRLVAVNQFSVDKILPQYLKLYEKALNQLSR